MFVTETLSAMKRKVRTGMRDFVSWPKQKVREHGARKRNAHWHTHCLSNVKMRLPFFKNSTSWPEASSTANYN